MKKMEITGNVLFESVKPTDQVKKFVEDYIQKWAHYNFISSSAPYKYEVTFTKSDEDRLVLCDVSIQNKYNDKWTDKSIGENAKKSFLGCLRQIEPVYNHPYSNYVNHYHSRPELRMAGHV